MKKRRCRKHTEAEYLSYMHMIEDGVSINCIHKEHGIDAGQLRVLWGRYQEKGIMGLKKQPNIKADFELRKKIVLDIEKNHLSLSAAALKYGASNQRVQIWLKTAREEGIEALRKFEKRGHIQIMPEKKTGRPKKNSRPLTELERLQKENMELKTEIALLKKVRALVDERNARLRGIGREPSKN